NSWRLDLTPYITPGGDNQRAIRIDNPPHSARWYPGGGIYRNVWLVKTEPVHVSQWWTFIKTREVSDSSATIDIEVTIDNDSKTAQHIEVKTEVYALNAEGENTGDPAVSFPGVSLEVKASKNIQVEETVVIKNPLLWGPPPTQKPNLYKAITILYMDGKPVDKYETSFGIRSLNFDSEKGIIVNGEQITLKGVNQHHDLGALGAAFNTRAAERQLEMLKDLGANAIRLAHNPPAPELLELTDRM